MTEQLNGYQRLIPAQADQVQRDAGDVEDLDVPNFLKDDQRDQVKTSDTSREFPQAMDSPLSADRHQTETLQTSEGLMVNDADEPRRPFHRTRIVAGHRVTRGAARQAAFVVAGAVLARRHLRDERSTARHHRFMRAAEAVGDHQAALLWEERASQHRAARHARRMQLLHAPVHAAKAVTYGSATALGVLLLVGVCLAAANHDPHEAVVPVMTAVDVVRFVVTLASILWAPAVLTAVFAGLMTLWSLGRRRAEMPAWLAPAGQADTGGAPITPSLVVVALRELGIADLRTKIKAMGDNGATMLSLIRIAGCGVEVDVTLPEGTSTLEIQNRRRKLAENLHRHEHEVFITIPPAARTVRLWIADSGALDEPIGPSPLALDSSLTADVYTGRAPWGQDLRGDVAALSMFQRHILLTGASNQGKTAALRALMLWAALDAMAEFWLADLKGVGDWRMFADLAVVLIQGPTDTHVAAACDMVDAGVTEMQARLMKLERSGATDGVTREMARKPGSGFHPLFVVIDESQVAFMCPAKDAAGRPLGGTKATSRFFMGCRTILNQGRAVNVHLVLGTQDPTDQNLPKLVREAFHIRGALFLGTESQSRMALGDTPVDQGAAPHKLRMGLDKGTLVVVGDGIPLASGQSSITVRTHFISGKDAIAIADRAKAMRKPVTTRDPAADVEDRDVLADVAAVLRAGETLVKSSEVVRRLAAADPDGYQGWTVNRLGTELAPHAVIPRKTRDGVMHVDHVEIRAAMDHRESVAGRSVEE